MSARFRFQQLLDAAKKKETYFQELVINSTTKQAQITKVFNDFISKNREAIYKMSRPIETDCALADFCDLLKEHHSFAKTVYKAVDLIKLKAPINGLTEKDIELFNSHYLYEPLQDELIDLINREYTA